MHHLENQPCIDCDTGIIQTHTVDYELKRFLGDTLTVPQVKILKCSDCGCVLIPGETSRIISDAENAQPKVILYVSDWNYQEKYYETTKDVLRKIKEDVLQHGIAVAWKNFTSKVWYPDHPQTRENSHARFVTLVDKSMGEYFWDCLSPPERIFEWDLDEANQD